MAASSLSFRLCRDETRFQSEILGALGARVFSTFIVQADGRLFHLSWHLQRLLRNLAALTLEQAVSIEALRTSAISALQEASPLMPGDVIKLALDSSGLQCLVAPYKRSWPIDSEISLLPVQIERAFPEIKSTASLPSVIARNYARTQGAEEALLVDREGYAREGAWSNLFWVQQKTLYTTKSNVLQGITRRDIIEHEECELVDMKLTEIVENAEEIFMTQSTTGITPVRSIVGMRNFELPGPVTQELQRRYLERVSKLSAPYAAPM